MRLHNASAQCICTIRLHKPIILEKKNQELKRKKWLEERNDEDQNGSDGERLKRIKIDEKQEVQVINRMWALPWDVKLKEKCYVVGFNERCCR